MKKFLLLLFFVSLFFNTQNVLAIENVVSLDEVENQPKVIDNAVVEPLPIEASVTFDWLDVDLDKRQEYIDYYKNLLFANNSSKIYYSKNDFKTTFAKYFKDKDFKHHYMLTNNGVTEDESARYCAFYYKKGTLLIYAIQYKDNPRKSFYYSPFGKLYYTDLISDEYPSFPYTSMQYDRKGNLKSAIYFVSKNIQYMFDANQEFQGIWYKDKMYDKEGKQTLTRTNW